MISASQTNLGFRQPQQINSDMMDAPGFIRMTYSNAYYSVMEGSIHIREALFQTAALLQDCKFHTDIQIDEILTKKNYFLP